MATIYKKNAQQVYKRPIYTLFLPWLILALATAGLITLINSLVSVSWLRIAVICLWLLVVIMIAVKSYGIYRGIRSAGSIGRYRVEQRSAKDITQNLLATMTLNRQQDSPHVTVPDVTVVDRTPSHLTVKIEKLAGMYDLDRLAEDVSGSFRGRLANYAVTSSRITTNGNEFVLTLEDVGSDRTWRPATLKEMKQPTHVLKLQKDLTINLADSPHLIFYGKSGSGKSTSLISVFMQALMWPGSQIYIADPKREFSALSDFYPLDRLAVEADEVIAMLNRVCDIVRDRQKVVSDGVRKRQKMGLRAYDLGLSPVVVMIDEVSALMASMDSKAKKEFLGLLTQIVMKGRSVSCFLILGNQSALAEKGITTDIRGQIATKIVLGKVGGSGEEYRMAFGEVATKGAVERFKGYYLTDGLEQPLLYAVTDLHSHSLNDLKTIKRAYEIGQKG